MPGIAASVLAHIEHHIEITKSLGKAHGDAIMRIAEMLGDSLRAGGTLYLCGNGGSAADAQHVAAEFVGRYLRDRAPLPAVALTTDTSVLTAIANDYDFTQVREERGRSSLIR
jgi:D-sedoheptulose 7-phosphate isomerase